MVLTKFILRSGDVYLNLGNIDYIKTSISGMNSVIVFESGNTLEVSHDDAEISKVLDLMDFNAALDD